MYVCAPILSIHQLKTPDNTITKTKHNGIESPSRLTLGVFLQTHVEGQLVLGRAGGEAGQVLRRDKTFRARVP